MQIDVLINPNIAYLLLVAGIMLATFAIFSPGTGVLEIGALISLVLAAWQIINLTINWWALAILLVGVFPFLLAVRFTQNRIYLIISITSAVVGSIFLFDLPLPGFQPAVNPFLAIITSTLVIGFFWIIATKSLQAARMEPAQDLGSLIGMEGKARTDVSAEGSVFVDGELWSARSSEPIHSGTTIRVIDREGLVLIVETVESKDK